MFATSNCARRSEPPQDHESRKAAADRLGGARPNPIPKRERAGVFQDVCNVHKYLRACAWGSDFAALSELSRTPCSLPRLQST